MIHHCPLLNEGGGHFFRGIYEEERIERNFSARPEQMTWGGYLKDVGVSGGCFLLRAGFSMETERSYQK